MRTLFCGRAYAEYRAFVVTDDYEYILAPEFTSSDDTWREGFRIVRPNVLVHYIQNELWSFGLVVHAAEAPPADLLDAERVIHLPFESKGRILLHGSTDWQKESFTVLDVGPGKYSVFSRGWNIGDYPASDRDCELSDEAFAYLPHIERYEWFICPMSMREAQVLSGPRFLQPA